jgi:hypothetical protein
VQFFAFVSTQFCRTIKVIQCDNGREFDNAFARVFFASTGVILRMSCPYTSLQNDKVECPLHIINNMIHPLLFQASMSARYWVEGLHTATYLLNRLPYKSISVSSPCKAISVSSLYVALYGVAPSYGHLHVFGCVFYPILSA